MNKIIMLACCLCFFAGNVFALEEDKTSTLNVDISISNDIVPDTAKIRFYVVNQGLNVTDLKEKNDKIVNQAINSIKARLSNNEGVKTISYRINSIYSYKDKLKVFQKYEVQNGFEVKLRDLTKISSIIQIATDSGVKRVDNVNFLIEDTNKTCNDMLKQATIDAKQRAEILAEALDTQIIKVKSVNPYCSLNSRSSRPVYMNAKADYMSSAETTNTVMETIEPGTINVSASVNLVYYLK